MRNVASICLVGTLKICGFELNIPPIAAVGAPVGDHVARFEAFIRLVGQQMCGAEAVDTRDGLGDFHDRSLLTGRALISGFTILGFVGPRWCSVFADIAPGQAGSGQLFTVSVLVSPERLPETFFSGRIR